MPNNSTIYPQDINNNKNDNTHHKSISKITDFKKDNANKQYHNQGILSTFWLKIIAIISMTIDHAGVCLGTSYINGTYYLSGFMSYDTYNYLRIIGRIAFPIFCYLIVEGFFYTKNVFNYITRLFLFGFISQVPFSLMSKGIVMDFSNTNVYFTLCIGLITITCLNYCKKYYKNHTISFPIFLLINTVIVICSTSFADTLGTDYAGYGICIIIIFYLLRGKYIFILLGILFTTLIFSSKMELYCLIALVPITLHNHKKGPSLKYFFYLYYPLHMLVLYFISSIVI